MRRLRVSSFRALRGQGLVEYGLSVGLLALAAAGIMKVLGADVTKAFETLTKFLTGGS
jgi:Flp pilus assembly pilin Flp